MKKSILNLGSYGSGHTVTRIQKRMLFLIKLINGIRWRLASRKQGTLTINIEGDTIGDEAFIDALVKKIDEAEKKIKD